MVAIRRSCARIRSHLVSEWHATVTGRRICNRDISIAIEPPRGFCAAPWFEAVVRIDGTVFPCCRVSEPLGHIQQKALGEIWLDQPFREFREQVATGRFPSRSCITCFADGKASTLFKLLDALLARHWDEFTRACDVAGIKPNSKLCRAMSLFHNVVRNARDQEISSRDCRRFIWIAAKQRHLSIDADGIRALRRLTAIARSCADFLDARITPRRVAPMRQVNLITACNARCRHCIGLYTREISRGVPVGQRYVKRMSLPDQAKAFDRPADIAEFFMNGSEFLLFPGWEKLVQDFARRRILLSLATNGMLLNRRASELLIHSRVLRDINFSFDGATKRTVETIRAGVKFDQLVRNFEDFLDLQATELSRLSISLSMVLLRDNFHEAVQLVELAHFLRRDRIVSLHVSFQLLNEFSQPEYAHFYAQNRVDLTHPVVAVELQAAADRGDALGIQTYYSYQGSLREALGRLDSRVGRIAT